MFARFQGPGCLLKFFPHLGILVKGFYTQTRRIVTFTILQEEILKWKNNFHLKHVNQFVLPYYCFILHCLIMLCIAMLWVFEKKPQTFCTYAIIYVLVYFF